MAASEDPTQLYWNPPDQYNVSRTFDQPLTSTGPCNLIAGLAALPRQNRR
jgi:hypothetical protein